MTKRFTGQRRPCLVLGTIAASGLVLSSCGDQPATEALYDSPAQCVASGVDADICNAEYQQALQTHQQNAPKFDAMAACEAEHGEGRCVEGGTSSSGGSFFMPFMTGYLMSSAISNLSNYRAYSTYRQDQGSGGSVPIYTGRSGQAYRSDPPAIGQPQSRPYNVNTRTVSRQGFGGLSSSRSSFGG